MPSLACSHEAESCQVAHPMTLHKKTPHRSEAFFYFYLSAVLRRLGLECVAGAKDNTTIRDTLVTLQSAIT